MTDNEKRTLMITTIVESLMDYSRQLIIDEHSDGQDYGSAAVVDGITFMKDLQGQPPATCSNCGLWDQRYAAMGECMLPWELDAAVRIDWHGNSEVDGAPALMTPGYHSCAGHKPRGE